MLRFIGTEAHVNDVAKFLGLTKRQARNIIKKLLEMGFVEEGEAPGYFKFKELEPRAYEVMANLLFFLSKKLMEK